MKYYFTILLSIVLLNLSLAQKIENYEAMVQIDKKSKMLHADFYIAFNELNKQDTLKLFVPESSEIHKVSSFGEVIDYETTNEKLVGEDKAIRIPAENIRHNKISIKYSYDLGSIKNPNFKYNPNWIELNIYTSWFPLNIEYGLFGYEVTLNTKDTIIGTSVTNKTTVKSAFPTFDIPIVLADKILETVTANGKIRLFHQDIKDSIVANIKEKSEQYFSKYTAMFGSTASDQLSITINPFNRSIVYARPQFISLSIKDKFNTGHQKTLAHEIAHLWWNKANVGTWEDWLNESFAEYSSLLIYKNENGAQAFQERIAAIKEKIKDLSPIWEIDKLNPNSNTILTYKGAYLLFLLEEKIESAEFLRLMKNMHQLKIKNTKGFLKVLADECGLEVSDWFKAALKE